VQRAVVLTQYRRVTDGQTDGNAIASITALFYPQVDSIALTKRKNTTVEIGLTVYIFIRRVCRDIEANKHQEHRKETHEKYLSNK